MSQGVDTRLCLPKTAWPSDFVATATCSSCHGLPPATGAHVAHVTGPDLLASPVDCSDCHVKPAIIFSPGHMDGTVDLFTAAMIGTGAISFADGAQSSWNDAAGTCSNTYCHGNGTLLKKDTSSGILRTPSWSGGDEAIVCGTCHGLPPKDGLHPTNSACQQCHSATIGDDGKFRFVNGVTTHMNGVIDGNR